MKKLSLVFSLAIVLSCSNEEGTKQDSNVDIVLNSTAFRSLGISSDELDLTNIEKTNTAGGLTVSMISFKDQKNPNKLLNLYNENGLISCSAVMRIESTLEPEILNHAFEQKNFDVKISFLASTGDYFGMDFKESKIVNYFIASSMLEPQGELNAKTQVGCKDGWTEKGGPLDCAGASLENDGPFSKADCYLSGFLPCFAWKVLDCWWTGCPTIVYNGSTYVIINGGTYPITSSVANKQLLVPTVTTPTRTTNISPITFE